jgi:hypothetical protein
VAIRSDIDTDTSTLTVGDTIDVDIWATLNGLAPDEVAVEALAEHPGRLGAAVDTHHIAATHVGTEGAEERYRAEIPVERAGELAIGVRVRATNGSAVANPYRHLLICSE